MLDLESLLARHEGVRRLAYDRARASCRARTRRMRSRPRAILRPGRWIAMLESREVKSLREIARKEGVDSSYVSRMVNLTTLATGHCRGHPRRDPPAGGDVV
jgi:hypothetical protein